MSTITLNEAYAKLEKLVSELSSIELTDAVKQQKQQEIFNIAKELFY